MDKNGLAETVAARLCHDLSGLAGTVMNTLELLEDEGGKSETMAVAADAARQLGGRLRLLRAAWGGVGGERDAAAFQDLLSHAARFPKVRTDWTAAGPGAFAPALARTLLNAALVGLESLPRGGVVRIAGAPGTAVTLTLDGAGARWPEGWVEAVAQDIAPETPESRQLQPALTQRFARTDGLTLSWRPAGGGEPTVLVIAPRG